MYHTPYLCNLIWSYYSFKLRKVFRWSECVLAGRNLQLAFHTVWACLMKGCRRTTIKTNGQHRGKGGETKRDETEEEESERVCKVKVSNNRVGCWQMHLASAVEEWGSSMSPCAGFKRCPPQHTAHKNLHEVSPLTGRSGSQTVSTLLLLCGMQQSFSASDLPPKQ